MERWSLAWLGLGVMVVMASGCGPSAPNDTTGADTTGNGTGSTSVSTTVTSQESSGSGIADTTGAELCAEFNDEPQPGDTVAIEIRNVGADTLLLSDPCFLDEYLELSTEAEWRWPGDFCAQTCEAEFAVGCIDCAGCASAAYTVLAPGAVLTLPWAGILYDRVMPPEECFAMGTCAANCQQARVPTDEMVAVRLEAIRLVDCVDAEPEPDVSCTCEPGPEGWCETLGQALIEPTVEATTEFAAGSAGPIVVEISG